MVVMDHNLPLLGIAQQRAAATRPMLAAFALSTASKDECARVSGIIQEREDAAVARLDPDQFAQMFGGQIQALLLVIEQDLPSAAQLLKRLEDSPNGLLHALIRMHLNPIIIGA